MIKKIFITLLFSLFFLTSTTVVSAYTKYAGDVCVDGRDNCSPSSKYSCQKWDSRTWLCLSKILKISEVCNVADPGVICESGSDCQFDSDADKYLCQKSDVVKTAFGNIKVPDVLRRFLRVNPTGAGAISNFLSNLIALIYTVAAIALLFMLLWGAFDWMISEGDKEKIASAQRKIINAIIGIILFAVAFAIIQVLGHFTGFTFFLGQK